MTLLIGPCMLLAPFAAVLAIALFPLWPVAIVLVGLARLVVWPVEHLLVAIGIRESAELSALLGRWFGAVLKPWKYFDPPKSGGE